ncbi:hypothetical protein GCM10027589_45300 [Actinocorallia lasiicapitis]
MPPPAPEGKAAELCAGLKLPAKVDGHDRRDTDPQSPYVSAWGSPAIALRCGVPRPVNADGIIGDVVDIDGLPWLPEAGDRPATWTLVAHETYVEVTIPGKYTPQGRPVGEILSEFSDALKGLPKLPPLTY